MGQTAAINGDVGSKMAKMIKIIELWHWQYGQFFQREIVEVRNCCTSRPKW
jgi:hypothetical protein